MTLDSLTRQASEERTLKAKARQALADGRITQAEYDYLLRKEIGASDAVRQDIHAIYAKRKPHHERRRETAVKAAATLLFLVLAIGIIWTLTLQQGPTGFVTLQPTQDVAAATNLVFTAPGDYALGALNTSALTITGTLENGTANVTLLTGNKSLLVWQGTAAAPQYAVSTEKESYALDEAVNVSVTPADASYTLWLTDEAGTKTVVENGFVTVAPGSYALDALINASGNITKASTGFLVRNDTNTSNDVLRAESNPSIKFTDACGETCETSIAGNVTLHAELSEGATLTIDAVTIAEPRTNVAPVLVGTMPNITVHVGETVFVDLATLFADADNDTLTYDYLAVPGTTMALNGSVLSVTGTSPGTAQSIVYASDLYAIAQSAPFTITVLATENATNATLTNTTNETGVPTGGNESNNTATNQTLNETSPAITNTTLNETSNNTATNQTLNETSPAITNTTLDCSNPDPNRRPLDCIQGANSTYFKPEELLIENKQAVAVGQLTPVGNLLIKGGLVEHTTGIPATSDYQLGYTNSDGDYVPTVWIDTATGNLNLKGTLTEVNGNLIYQPGLTALTNERGIILALIDRNTGDMAVRGNLVPYRRSLS